jgi:hypothetical protein
LTQPLCQYFSHVIGVDVAPSMIELAKRYNHIANTSQHPGDYILELDMVQEAVAWFHDKGSKTAKVQVCIKTNLENLEKTPKILKSCFTD